MNKKFLTILLILSISISFSQEKSNNTVYVNTTLDSMPMYPDGEAELYQFIGENFHVNQSIIRENGNANQVMVVSFIVDTSGSVSDIVYPQSNGVMAEIEMTKVLNSMPKWKPGYINQDKIATRVYIPIRYIIQEHEFYVLNSGTEMVVGNSKKNRALKAILVIGSLTIFSFKISKSLL